MCVGVDTTSFNGVTMFERGATDIIGPDYPFDTAIDAVMYLNGHGSYKSLEVLLNDAVQASAHPDKANIVFTVSINYATDRVTIQCNKYNFTLAETGNSFEEVLGFTADTGDWDSSPYYSGVVSTLVAPGEWTRGDFVTANLELELDPGGTSTSLVFGESGRCQDVPILLRHSGPSNVYAVTGVDDADDRSDNESLQSADNSSLGTINCRWGLTAEGHVFVSYNKGFSEPSSWDEGSRVRLGFSGDETGDSLSSNYEEVVADNPMPCCLFPTRPLDSFDIQTDQVGGAIRLKDSRVASNLDAIHHLWRGVGWLDGPNDIRDLHLHYHLRVLLYLFHGYPLAIYQDWGDSRRAQESLAENDYSTLYTIEKNHYRGRVVGRVSLNNGTSQLTSWPTPMRRRAPLTFWILVSTDV